MAQDLGRLVAELAADASYRELFETAYGETSAAAIESERRAVGLTFLEDSVLTEKTELGPRSFPLTGLARLPSESRELILSILQRPPASDFLSLSAYTPSRGETIPAASIRLSPLVTSSPT
jgi:hypothetical protein